MEEIETQKRKTKIEDQISNSIFNVVGKRKTKTVSRIPFSDDVGKRKTKLEVGTKVHALKTV